VTSKNSWPGEASWIIARFKQICRQIFQSAEGFNVRISDSTNSKRMAEELCLELSKAIYLGVVMCGSGSLMFVSRCKTLSIFHDKEL